MKRILFLILLILILIPTNIFALELTCPNAILIDVESGKILYEKNAYEECYPASTTKIMTVLLALENCDLSETATASYNAVMSVPYDGTTAAIQVGETWTIKQLIDAMMVCSANEAANIVAEHVGGSIESFASMMNSRAKELGAKSTNFVNPNGLHDDKHKTTVYDMAMITRYAMQNFPEFKEAAMLTKFSLPDTNIYSKGDRNFTTTNKMLIPSSSYYYKYATGIKTGYTSRSLNCIVSSAEKDGVELIAIVFGAEGAQNRTADTIALFEYGFEEMKCETFATAGSIIGTYDVSGASSEMTKVSVTIDKDITHTISSSDNSSNYEPEIVLNSKLKAPISSGDVLGTLKYTIEDNTYEYPLIAINSVGSITENIVEGVKTTAKVIGKIIFWAVIAVIGMLAALILIRAAVMTKNQQIRRRRMFRYNSRFR